MPTQITNQIKLITASVLPKNSKIGFFGSRVKGNPSKFSDVDIAILGPSKIPGHTMEVIREILEKSSLPLKVDLLDLSQTSKHFREKVEKEIIWIYSKN